MKEFIFPTRFVWEKETYKPTYGKLTVEPLERGYGVTLGNGLRRILLSSIPGVAITALHIEGTAHEFSTIKGVKEDVVEIVLNLKQIALKPIVSEFPHTVRIELKGKPEICAEDLFSDGSVEVLNKELHIATIDPDKKVTLEIEVSHGFGYLPLERLKFSRKTNTIGTIPIDGIYTPIRKVTFHTENTRVGQSVDYEKLILEVWTTGAVEPKESVATATTLLNRHITLIETEQTVGEPEKKVVEKAPEIKEADLSIPITELKLSTRVCNALTAKNIHTLDQLLQIPRERFEEMKNLGKKSIEEIEEALHKRGFKFLTFAANSSTEEA